MEPQSSILAKLCVYCIFSTLEYNNSNPYRGNNRKRVRRDLDTDDLDALGVSNKLLRLNETGESVPMFSSQSPQTQGSNNGQKSVVVLRDPLMTALNNLFTIFAFLAGRDGEVSQQTHFILQFLRLMVQCGKDRTRIVLQGIPQTLVRFGIYIEYPCNSDIIFASQYRAKINHRLKSITRISLSTKFSFLVV